jgi:uncharacterized protein
LTDRFTPNRLRHWALTRVVLEAAALVVTELAILGAFRQLTRSRASPLPEPLAICGQLLMAALLLGAYCLMVRWLERRRVVELDARAMSMQLAVGLLMGMALMAAVYGLLWIAGHASFQAGSGLSGLGVGLSAAFSAAVFEELLFRAVLFRIVEQSFGTTIALLASAALFGAVHGANPGATISSDAAIAVEAGLLLAVAYMLTRNLGLVIGMHTGWNFAEGNLFGAVVSGHSVSHSVMQATLTGSVRLTGGNFGPEASVVAIAVCCLAALVMGRRVVVRGGWLPLVFRPTLP